MLDEVRFYILGSKDEEIYFTLMQNVQYFLLAIFWFTSKPITGSFFLFYPL